MVYMAYVILTYIVFVHAAYACETEGGEGVRGQSRDDIKRQVKLENSLITIRGSTLGANNL